MSGDHGSLRSDLGVVACRHVADGLRDVGLVTHLGDGDWSFTCGASEHSRDGEGANGYVLVHAQHLLSADPSLDTASDLPEGWSAERDGKGEPWRRFADPD